MPTPNSSYPQVTIKLRGPADLLALLPYLLGCHPSQSLCLVGLNDSEVACAICYDLPVADCIEALIPTLIDAVADIPVSAVLLVGYGTDPEVTPALNAALAALAAIEIPATEALRAEEGRYVPHLCGNKIFCPSEGIPYEIGTSAVAAEAIACGLSALPDRDGLAARITPQRDPSRTAIEAATRAAGDIGQQMHEPGGAYGFISEVRDTITTALDLYRDGRRLSEEAAARLSVFLGMTRLRDEIWVTITPEAADSHLALWTDMTRRVSINVAACASLLAFTALLIGDCAFASIAIDRATDADPGYTMAHLLSEMLAADLTPILVADIMPTAEDLATDDPESALPETPLTPREIER